MRWSSLGLSLAAVAALFAGCSNSSGGGTASGDAGEDSSMMDSSMGDDSSSGGADSSGSSSGADGSSSGVDGSSSGADSSGSSSGGDSSTGTEAGSGGDSGNDGGMESSACGSAKSCTAPADCPAQATKCIVNDCTSSCCATTNAASGTMCNDNGGQLCNGTGSCVECIKGTDCNPEAGLLVCSAAGNCVQCNLATDCPTPLSKCLVAACTGNSCKPTNAAQGTMCNDNGGAVCNGKGACVQCNSDQDCSSFAADAGIAVCDLTTARCDFGCVKAGDEAEKASDCCIQSYVEGGGNVCE